MTNIHYMTKYPLRRIAPNLFVLALAGTLPLCGQGLNNGDFEANPFLTGWSSAGTVQSFGGLAPGSTRAAWLASSGNARLGQNLTPPADWQQDEWQLDFYFAITNAGANRAFSLFINAGSDATDTGLATVNLRYHVGQFNTFASGSWGADLGLGTIAHSVDTNGDGDFNDAGDTKNVYHFRFTGRNWGRSTASYDLALSAANSTNFTAFATNLSRWQNAQGVDSLPTAFIFNTVFGFNPGFWVDDVKVSYASAPPATSRLKIGGTYPHLAVFSSRGEIGIGAVVPWADKLWFVTYPPHYPNGSADKLWTVDSNLTLTARPESVGSTDANRLVHRESQQLNIGHYLIDSNGTVRAMSPAILTGRLTGSARHLTDPTNKIYIATMEEGLYEVDVNTLAVTELYHDMNTGVGAGQKAAAMPGNHGKGLYSSQDRLAYSNNGNGGSLSVWDGTNWTVIETNKFTEVTGPGGVYGNDPSDDRLWAVGWDARSVILRLFQNGAWTEYRLPKGSYTHDADSGVRTEWPRIREIVDGKLLMHMHGLFYYFPKTFSATNTAGINPICTYLKMPVDYCWWNGQLVMGRDDASTTGGNIWAGQSHSAPWFGQLSDLETWGTPAGFGGVWLNDSVTANTPSEAFLVNGFKRRVLHLKHAMAATVNFTLQHDPTGLGAWTNLTTISVASNGYAFYLLPPTLNTTWVRLVPDNNATGVTAYFHLQNPPPAPTPELFASIADAATINALSDGIIRPQGGDARTLQFAATLVASNGAATTAYYEMDGALQLRRTTNATAENTLRTTYSLSNANFTADAASVIYTEGANRFRLPKTSAAYESAFVAGWPRGAREVVTERQLFQAHGTFYELPYSDSGGFRRIRPITTHNKHISDFASWRGLLAVAGVATSATNNGHVFRSDDGQAALWFGDVDDLWRMGTLSGTGGPWKDTAVAADRPSDPYLMLGYEGKVVELSHAGTQPVNFTIEVDFAADDTWSEYARFTVLPGQTVKHIFPEGYSAHWVRLKSDVATTATTTFTYGSAAPLIAGLSSLPDGNFRLTFTGSAGQPFTVLSSTDLAAPLSGWGTLTNGTFSSMPVAYDDLTATNSARRFYVISMP